MVGARIREITGLELDRSAVKILNFQAMYGGGAPAASRALDCSLAEAREFKAYHDRALPGRRALSDAITRLVRRGIPITTWGGRKYFPEPPRDGRTFEYKLLNYLIQGSAADLTKQAMIDWYNDSDREARFMVQVYDEINISAPKERWREEMAILKRHMEAPRLDVTMLSDAAAGPSWGKIEDIEDE